MLKEVHTDSSSGCGWPLKVGGRVTEAVGQGSGFEAPGLTTWLFIFLVFNGNSRNVTFKLRFGGIRPVDLGFDQFTSVLSSWLKDRLGSLLHLVLAIVQRTEVYIKVDFSFYLTLSLLKDWGLLNALLLLGLSYRAPPENCRPSL